jgi:hypothetical protein
LVQRRALRLVLVSGLALPTLLIEVEAVVAV